MAPKPCLTCGTPTTRGSRCTTCQKAKDAAKWNRNPNRDQNYRKLRAAVAAQLPLPCALCGDPITHTGHDAHALTLDHIQPWSDSHNNNAANLRPTHKRCNSSRGRGTPTTGR